MSDTPNHSAGPATAPAPASDLPKAVPDGDQAAKFALINGIDRQTLFSNESFLIGMLQAVALAALIGAVSGTEEITKASAAWAHALLISLLASALAAAIGASYYKHQYKMFDMKGAAHVNNRIRDLARMRALMKYSTWLLWAAIAVIPIGLWVRVVRAWCQ